MRERFLKGKTKKRVLTYSILVLYRALVRFISVEIKCLLFLFLWNHVLCGSWAESNISEGKLRLVNHRFVLYDITHQQWNPGLNKVNESFTIDFNGVTVSSRTFSHILSYIGDTRILWFSTEWTNYLSVLQKRKRKKSKEYEVAGKAKSSLDHVICMVWECKAGFNFYKPYFRIKWIQSNYLVPWIWTRKAKILGGICLYGQYFKTGTRWQTISGLW